VLFERSSHIWIAAYSKLSCKPAIASGDPSQLRRFKKPVGLCAHANLGALTARMRVRCIEIGRRELPLEWVRDALEAALEVRQPLSDRLQAREVVRGQRLALRVREVDLALVEPTRRAPNREPEPFADGLAGGAAHKPRHDATSVVLDPGHTVRGVLRRLTHDLIDPSFERHDAGGRFASGEHLGAMHVQRGPVRPGTAAERPPAPLASARRAASEAGMDARAWMLVSSWVEMTNSSSRRDCPCQQRSYRSRTRAALVWRRRCAQRSSSDAARGGWRLHATSARPCCR